ncbi:hypothetical protein PIB30_028022 [Stylosanthes scabra]|uniref:GBF-interacting protein 1 N-terminal domain-containing protein n=1 Tax=Stylosanthes scabra TaxID=79078 RepID=A0ABU6Z7T3_9FABA|nr:hypothetical protein [Stylosanthes scabra]
MSGGGGSSRVPIPNNVRKTIHDIREITGKQHTDDEIYAVLRECSMDPNETAQKLLYLDTFHEVRRRRDRKKEGFGSRTSEDSRPRQGGQGRGPRGASGGYASNFSDGGGGRNVGMRRENGVNHNAERSHVPSSQPVLQKTKANAASQVTRVPANTTHGATAANQTNGKSGNGSGGQSVSGNVSSVSKSSSTDNNTGNQEDVQPQVADVAAATSPIQTFNSVTSIEQGKPLPSSDQILTSAAVSTYTSSLDPVPASSTPHNPGVNSSISREVGSHWINAGTNHVKGNKVVLNEASDLLSKNENSVSVNSGSKMSASYMSTNVENNRFFETSQASAASTNGNMGSSSSFSSQPAPANVSEVPTSDASVQSSAELRQHVTFPNHFPVPKALKSGLTFGSFDTVGPNETSSSGADGDNNPSPSLESSLGSDKDAISRDQSATLSQQGDQEVLLTPEVHQIPNVQNAQNYYQSIILGNQQVQFEGTEPQSQETSRFSNFVPASSPAVTSPSQTPPLQSSIPVPPQSVSLFRPPYPANFFPYGHYYPPIYLSPIHQYLSHNGFPQQASTGNMYLPTAAAAAAAAGIKFPLPQFKAGANTGNSAHIGIPSGSYINPPVGYAPNPTVNAGSSAGNEVLSVSQLKENHIYTTAQQSEGSAVWIPAPGQDISNLQVNSLYNFPPQGQHLTFPPPQPSPGAFAGIYPPGQTVVSHSTLLQQSQAVAGPVEAVGPPSGSYHQPQPTQINWNSNY